MRLHYTADLWWKNAVIYCLDVETYRDGNGDGVGDFRGLIQSVDHLDRLGVTCIWLMPFYPTPDRDDGYDVTDFYGVDPRLGSLGDFVEFIRTARDRGMRVIADLVVNHTSDQHPWFQSARESRESPYRDFYVWVDEPPEDGPKGITFPDQEDSLWRFDERAGQYYHHRFYRHQPDLNVANPAVRDEIVRIMGFWMELGLSGFRVDAVPFLLETPAADDEAMRDPHDYLADVRASMNRRNGESVLLGEVNLPYPDTARYFGQGNGDELTMCFDFIGMQRIYLSLARGDATPLAESLRDRPRPPTDGHWANFVRNHDELTLDKLTDEERKEVFAAFGPEERMQLYGRGLRRRVPPMMSGDTRRIKLMYSLLFSLPAGTPVLFYGEEIGLAENLDVEGRNAVRVPMQWAPVPGGGFSTADPEKFPTAPVTGEYGPERVNVRDQRRDPDSLLSWVGLLIERYRESPELAWGEYTVLDTGVPAVLAHRCDVEEETVVVLHNFAEDPAEVRLALDGVGDGKILVDLLTDGTTELEAGGRVALRLDGYGCRWLRALPRHSTGTD